MRCGRRDDFGGMGDRFPGPDEWRDDGTCSYCGSMNPDEMMRGIRDGTLELGPTDKGYKAYVGDANPNAGKPRIITVTNRDCFGEDGWLLVTEENVGSLPDPEYARRCYMGRWVRLGPDSATRQRKFYFQHMSEEQRREFIELLNAGTVRIGYPGYFYVTPFFIERVA